MTTVRTCAECGLDYEEFAHKDSVSQVLAHIEKYHMEGDFTDE